jgi:hypothetical protein
MIIEGIITLVILSALFYVAPGVLGTVRAAAPIVYGTAPTTSVFVNGTVDAQLNQSVTQIGVLVPGALNISTVGIILLGIGLMLGGFMYVRGGKNY